MATSPLPLAPGGFPPHTWGPQMWHVIHTVAAAFPLHPTPRDRDNVVRFYRGLGRVLPCAECAADYSALIASGRLRLETRTAADRMTLFSWTVAVHDAVNAKLGKPVVGADLLGVYARYDALRYEPPE